MKNIPDPRYI